MIKTDIEIFLGINGRGETLLTISDRNSRERILEAKIDCSELVSIYNRNRLYNMFDNMKMQQLDDFNTAINEAIGLLKEAGVK